MLNRVVWIIAFAMALLRLSSPFTSGESMAVGADQPPPPSRWPMQAQTADGTAVTIFQPQMDDFQGDTLTARAAVSVTPIGQSQPIFGAIWMTSRVSTDRVARTVQVQDVIVTSMRFPDAAPVSQDALSAAVKQAILSQAITLSLDQLLEMLANVQQRQTAATELDSNPPKILFVDHPAFEVQYDGDPRFVQASDSNLLHAVNTPFFVALDPSTKTYFLKGGGQWFSASDPLGPFHLAGAPPAPISTLADSLGYQDPQTPISDDQANSVQIITATEPTELIWTDGQPEMVPISGTSLLYWDNTTSDVFLQIDSQKIFVLLSGRWFTAPGQNGPWSSIAPNQLPPDFAKIPLDSPKANVLAFVAGTQQAQDAVSDAAIPQTAAVDYHNFDQPVVEYDGDPSFQSIEGTTCNYAINCGTPVIQAEGNYYCCYNGVWYLSSSAVGPWGLCTRVPHVIYSIPPSCPVYSVTFVYIYGFTGNIVYVGYTPGYLGCFPFNGVVVYGTGFHYKPWIGHRFIPHPFTYGFAARYDAYSGHWGFQFGLALGGGNSFIREDRHIGDRGGSWFGFGGYRPAILREDVHMHTNFIVAHNENLSRLQQQSKDRDVYGRDIYDRRKDIHRDLTPPAPPKIDHSPAKPNPDNHDNLFVDHQGNVYRRTDNGWETRDHDKWTPSPNQPSQPRGNEPIIQHGPDNPPHQETPPHDVQPPPQPHPVEPARNEPPPQADHGSKGGNQGDLDRDYRARQEGQDRSPPHQEQPHQEQPHQQEQPRPQPQPQQQPNNQPGQGPAARGSK